jgi:hypothetical protein
MQLRPGLSGCSGLRYHFDPCFGTALHKPPPPHVTRCKVRGHQVYAGLEIQQQGQRSAHKTEISWLACYPDRLNLHVSLAYWPGSGHEDAFKRGQICII